MRISFAPIQNLIHLGVRGATPSPVRDWKRLLLVFALLFIVSGSFSLYTYVRIGSDPNLSHVSSESVTLPIEEVRRAAAFFEARERRYESILENTTPLVDPAR